MPYYPEKRPDLAEREKLEKAAQQRKKLLRLFIVFPACALIAWGVAGLARYISDLSASRQTSSELREIYDRPEPEPAGLPAEIPETPVPAATEAPVTAAPAAVETPAPSSVLLLEVPYPDNPHAVISGRFRDLRKKGKYTARLETRPYTVILYGHNMKSGNMFGRLRKFRDISYLQKNRAITFDTLYEDGRYVVFAAAEINTVPGTSAYFDIWSLNDRTADGRTEALRKLKIRSLHGFTADVQPEDQVLLLVTCVEDDDYRFIVAARRLRPGEM